MHVPYALKVSPDVLQLPVTLYHVLRTLNRIFRVLHNINNIHKQQGGDDTLNRIINLAYT